MIPLRDDVPSRTVPYVNYAFIGINVLLFLYEVSLGGRLEGFLFSATVVPKDFTGHDGALALGEIVTTSLTPPLGGRVLLAMFLHGGWLHLIGNMLFLWIFGDNVEDRMGHVKYAIFYLLCGWTASYAHIWSDPTSALPSLGASGAIAGVLGAYITLYPNATVLTLIPLGFFTRVMPIPAFFFLGIWFLEQALAGATTLSKHAQSGGVAWWAHIGGFAAGFILVWVFQNRKRRPPQSGQDWWARH